MTKRVLLLFALSFCVGTGVAQDTKPSGKWYGTIGYFGEKVFNPGVQFSVNRSLFPFNGGKDEKNRIDVGISLAVYIHAQNHVGLRIAPGVAYVHATPKGFEYGLKADAGFFRRFYQGEVFAVDDKGEVQRKYFTGQNSFSYGLFLVLAKNWTTAQSRQFRLFVEVGGFQETHFNGSNISHPTLYFGLSRYFR